MPQNRNRYALSGQKTLNRGMVTVGMDQIRRLFPDSGDQSRDASPKSPKRPHNTKRRKRSF